jgi:hypothetical protein
MLVLNVIGAGVAHLVTRLWAACLGFNSGQGQGFFLCCHIHTPCRVQTSSFPMGTRGFFPGSEADHSPLSSAEVKNICGAILSLSHISSWCGA